MNRWDEEDFRENITDYCVRQRQSDGLDAVKFVGLMLAIGFLAGFFVGWLIAC